jgi:hypothetical protein
MHKRLLIITANYFPEESSIAHTAQPLFDKLIENGYQIDILTDKQRINVPNFEIIRKCNIHRVNDYYKIGKNILLEQHKKKGILQMQYYYCLKLYYFLRYRFLQPAYRPTRLHKKEVLEKAISIYNQNKFDAILSLSLPFKSHNLAYAIKQKLNNEVKWFAFEFDPYTYVKELSLSKKQQRQAFQDEYMTFDKCDALFLTPELCEFYKDTPLKKFVSKAIPTCFAHLQPLKFSKETSTDIQLNKNKINCLFLGKFYEEVRNPKFLLNIFSEIEPNVHLTCMTNVNEIDFTKYNVNKKHVTLIPFQPRDVALNAMRQANILINIGNTVLGQIPAKSFEYMGSGKPIIHISKQKKDPSLIYLEKYPHVLVINEWENDIKNDRDKILSFCKKYCNTTLSFDDVSKSLGEFSSDFVTTKFVKKVDDLIGD